MATSSRAEEPARSTSTGGSRNCRPARTACSTPTTRSSTARSRSPCRSSARSSRSIRKGGRSATSGSRRSGWTTAHRPGPTATSSSADEHTVLVDPEGRLRVGDRVRLLPAHLDPTVARHERFWVVDGDAVVDCWPIDLRHW
ncbi:MAG: hypothetical protein R2695_08895 [Acidimicrobiales bacterium]